MDGQPFHPVGNDLLSVRLHQVRAIFEPLFFFGANSNILSERDWELTSTS